MLQINRVVSKVAPGITDASVTFGTHSTSVFDIQFYQKIAAMSDNPIQSGYHILVPINMFLATLSVADQVNLFTMYFVTNETVRNEEKNLGKYPDDFEDVIAKSIAKVLIDLRIAEKLLEFCKNRDAIQESFPDFYNVMQIEHHIPEKTFFREDYADLLVLTLLTQLLIPISGQISRLFSDPAGMLKTELLITEVLDMVADHKDSPIRDTYVKLENMISDITEKAKVRFDRVNGDNATKRALAANQSSDSIFLDEITSLMLIKRLPTFRFFGPENAEHKPNLLVYLDDGIKRSVHARLTVLKKKIS